VARGLGGGIKIPLGHGSTAPPKLRRREGQVESSVRSRCRCGAAPAITLSTRPGVACPYGGDLIGRDLEFDQVVTLIRSDSRAGHVVVARSARAGRARTCSRSADRPHWTSPVSALGLRGWPRAGVAPDLGEE
jgi:hypothetical protein